MNATVEAQRVLDWMHQLSVERSHNYLGSDHLAVALLSEPGTEAAESLKGFGQIIRDSETYPGAGKSQA